MAPNIKELLTNQKPLRLRLIRYMKEKGVSFIPMAQEVKISPSTLRKFLMSEEDLVLQSIMKINAFLHKHENQSCEDTEEE
jgi:predicted transcriptional regulator